MPGHFGPIIKEVIVSFPGLFLKIAVWLSGCLIETGLPSGAGCCRSGSKLYLYIGPAIVCMFRFGLLLCFYFPSVYLFLSNFWLFLSGAGKNWLSLIMHSFEAIVSNKHFMR